MPLFVDANAVKVMFLCQVDGITSLLHGVPHLQNIILKDALYIPNYKSDIFSELQLKRVQQLNLLQIILDSLLRKTLLLNFKIRKNYTFLISQLIRMFLIVQHIVSIRFLQEIQRKITKPLNNGITF